MIPGKKLIISLWLGALLMLSAVIAAPMVSSPDSRFARSLMESGDRKIETTLELAAASSAASLAVSAIPGDTATPVAEKLADFGSGFLLVLCALYFEKSMYTVLGFAAFAVIFPVAIGCCIIGLFRKGKLWKRLAGCLALTGVLVWLMVPVSLGVSDMVYMSQQGIIQETLRASGDLSLEVEEGVEEEGTGGENGTGGESGTGDENGAGNRSGTGDKSSSGVESGTGNGSGAGDRSSAGKGNSVSGRKGGQSLMKQVLTTVSSVSAETVKKAKALITGYLQALALMIVTACVIPLAVVLLFVWAIKMVFQVGLRQG